MKEEINNLKKDIVNFINEDREKQKEYIDGDEESDILNEGFYSGRISAFEQVMELMEYI